MGVGPTGQFCFRESLGPEKSARVWPVEAGLEPARLTLKPVFLMPLLVYTHGAVYTAIHRDVCGRHLWIGACGGFSPSFSPGLSLSHFCHCLFLQ